MNLFGFLKARGSAPVARERLQILLAHERVALGPRDLVAILRDGRVIVPNNDDPVEAGDELLFVTSEDVEEELGALLAGR